MKPLQREWGIARRCVASITLSLLTACAIHPSGESAEIERADAVGRTFDEGGEPPPLPDHPTADDWLRAAFYANADLRARYWEWRAALERVPQVASPPKTAISFAYLFSDEHMKSWDRTTLGLSTDPMSDVPFPTKLATEGERALEDAKAAGRRFAAAKFALQAQVLSLYDDLALHAVWIEFAHERVALLERAAANVEARVRTGAASQQGLLDARNAVDLARNEIENLHSELPPMTARMNALVGREPDAPVALPDSLPSFRPVAITDGEMLRAAAERSPELEARAHEIASGERTVERARQEWLPDFTLSFNITGSLSQMLAGTATLPTRVEAIRAGIREAQADLERAREARTQYQRDLAASFVLDLYVLRNAERQVSLFEDALIPRTVATVRSADAALASGQGSVADEIAAQLALLDARRTVAELRTDRDKALVALETWSALDVEALHLTRMQATLR